MEELLLDEDEESSSECVGEGDVEADEAGDEKALRDDGTSSDAAGVAAAAAAVVVAGRYRFKRNGLFASCCCCCFLASELSLLSK